MKQHRIKVKTRLWKLFIGCVVTGFAVVSQSFGADLYVDANAEAEGGNGSQAAP